MRRYYIYAITLLSLGLAGCAAQLNNQDRALLADIRNMAEKSLEQSESAVAEARAARESAEKAAAAAREAGNKAERIFSEAQKK